jgi:hypothetical protein
VLNRTQASKKKHCLKTAAIVQLSAAVIKKVFVWKKNRPKVLFNDFTYYLGIRKQNAPNLRHN